jgi:hypothetical protein
MLPNHLVPDGIAQHIPGSSAKGGEDVRLNDPDAVFKNPIPWALAVTAVREADSSFRPIQSRQESRPLTLSFNSPPRVFSKEYTMKHFTSTHFSRQFILCFRSPLWAFRHYSGLRGL